jgi:hypothetical protein
MVNMLSEFSTNAKRPSLANKRLWIMYKNNFQKSPKNILKIQIKPGQTTQRKKKKKTHLCRESNPGRWFRSPTGYLLFQCDLFE